MYRYVCIGVCARACGWVWVCVRGCGFVCACMYVCERMLPRSESRGRECERKGEKRKTEREINMVRVNTGKGGKGGREGK